METCTAWTRVRAGVRHCHDRRAAHGPPPAHELQRSLMDAFAIFMLQPGQSVCLSQRPTGSLDKTIGEHVFELLYTQ